MNGVLGGFATLGAVIALGWLLGRIGTVGAGASGMLSRLSFYVAMPALLFLTLAEADTTALWSAALLATVGGAVLSGLLYAGVARARRRSSAAELMTGALACCYVNAGNLGIPIAVYVLGDASYVAPVLLFQVLVLAPLGLAVLAGSGSQGDAGTSRWQVVSRPVRTPLVVASGLGVLVTVTGVELPALLLQPVELVAGLAVPAALLAYGMSLHGAPRPATGDSAGQVWLAVALKTVVHPALTYALGRWVADLDGVALLAVTVTAALPTAQNIFVYASTYDRGVELARDTILLTTALSVPVLLVVAVVLG